MFQAKLASVNPNHRKIAIFRHVTFGISGLHRDQLCGCVFVGICIVCMRVYVLCVIFVCMCVYVVCLVRVYVCMRCVYVCMCCVYTCVCCVYVCM